MTLTDSELFCTKAFIDGRWCDADGGETNAVHNPATGELIAEVARCGRAETERAVAAATQAQRQWRKVPAKERSRLLRALYDEMMREQSVLAEIMTLEQGKPLHESKGEIAYGASFLEWFSEEAKRVYGDTIPGPASDRRIVVTKEPVGVVGCITPWNFPNAMLTRKLGPALAVGCTVVCKPANATPLSALAIGALAERVGIPPGVINILVGNTQEIGEVLTTHPDVRKITFTGSTEVGKTLIKACADTVKRTSMELGGNAPFIVFDDANLDAAVDGAIASKYRNAGQTCVCANRMLVQQGVYDEFAQRLAERVAALKVGNGMDAGVEIGPLIDTQAAADVMSMIEDAKSRGAKVLIGGEQGPGSFVSPTVLTDVDADMRVFTEEIFGPVAPLISFETEEEAIALANQTEFGLAAYFYSRDIGRIWRVAEGIEYGIVGVNEGIISNEMAPFGGMKESGNGREGSKYGMDEYLEIKYLLMGGLDD